MKTDFIILDAADEIILI